MLSNLKSIFAVYLAAVLLIGGCSKTASQNASGGMRENVHPNGLSVKLNENFAARQTGDGFLVEPSGGANQNLRVPVEIKIDFRKGKNSESATFRHEKSIGSRIIRYDIEKSEGGSGGETYEFAGVEQVSGGAIDYRQTTQSKAGEPDFSELWAIVETTSLKK